MWNQHMDSSICSVLDDIQPGEYVAGASENFTVSDLIKLALKLQMIWCLGHQIICSSSADLIYIIQVIF